MYNMLCKSCYCTWTVSEREVAHSDNGWFYCTNCGSGNTEIIED
jgi:Zn finger protein HypA/HybF involved in hydrogenase expression